MRPKVDLCFYQLWDIEKIVRYNERIVPNPHPLDKYFGIDGHIVLKPGCKITFQEKIRHKKYLRYHDLCIEYKSNKSGRKGEWFNLASDIYFLGFTNTDESNLLVWDVFDVLGIKEYVAENWETLKQKIRYNSQHSSASFIPVPILDIPEWCIINSKI